jgi:hypothetical protein
VSTVARELVLIGRGFQDRVDRLRRIAARAAAGPMLVRLGVYAAGVPAQVLAYPSALVWSAATTLLLALAALPALFPRTAAVSVFWLLTVFGWLAATSVYGELASIWRLSALTGALYLVHSGAALAAVLPYDAVVDPMVVARWLVPAAVLVAGSSAFVWGALVWVTPLGAQRSYLAASVLGLALMVVLAWYLTRARHRGN